MTNLNIYRDTGKNAYYRALLVFGYYTREIFVQNLLVTTRNHTNFGVITRSYDFNFRLKFTGYETYCVDRVKCKFFKDFKFRIFIFYGSLFFKSDFLIILVILTLICFFSRKVFKLGEIFK